MSFLPPPPPPFMRPMGLVPSGLVAGVGLFPGGVVPVIPSMRKPIQPPPTEPNQTLYIRNLNESKSVKSLIRHLTTLLSSYGKILLIKANKTKKLQGQAFVVFDSLVNAQKAMKELNGFPIFNKPMA